MTDSMLHEHVILKMYAADILLAYIRDESFRKQVDAIVNDTSVKMVLGGEEIDSTDLRLSTALEYITDEWLKRYYQELE